MSRFLCMAITVLAVAAVLPIAACDGDDTSPRPIGGGGGSAAVKSPSTACGLLSQNAASSILGGEVGDADGRDNFYPFTSHCTYKLRDTSAGSSLELTVGGDDRPDVALSSETFSTGVSTNVAANGVYVKAVAQNARKVPLKSDVEKFVNQVLKDVTKSCVATNTCKNAPAPPIACDWLTKDDAKSLLGGNVSALAPKGGTSSNRGSCVWWVEGKDGSAMEVEVDAASGNYPKADANCTTDLSDGHQNDDIPGYVVRVRCRTLDTLVIVNEKSHKTDRELAKRIANTASTKASQSCIMSSSCK